MMAATVQLKAYTGTSGAMENPTTGAATNFNLLSFDKYDTTGTWRISYPVSVPVTGNSYSFERILRFKFNGIATAISGIKAYSGWAAPTGVTLLAGISDTATSPKNTASGVAVSAIPTSVGSALDLTPGGGLTPSTGYSKYLYLQLKVASTCVVVGDLGEIPLELTYTGT